ARLPARARRGRRRASSGGRSAYCWFQQVRQALAGAVKRTEHQPGSEEGGVTPPLPRSCRGEVSSPSSFLTSTWWTYGFGGGTVQMRTVWSQLLLTSRLPSGLKATRMAIFVCPSNVVSTVPVFASHRRTVLSSPALASTLPSGLNTRPRTPAVWPVSVRSS